MSITCDVLVNYSSSDKQIHRVTADATYDSRSGSDNGADQGPASRVADDQIRRISSTKTRLVMLHLWTVRLISHV